MITFCTFLWPGPRAYQPEHVNLLAHAVRYFYPEEHRFLCVSGIKGDFTKGIDVIPPPKGCESLGAIPAPQGHGFPSSYRRLWLFSEAAHKAIQGPVVLLDVDSMIVGDLRPLIDPYLNRDFVGWRPAKVWGREKRIGGGTWLHNTGTLTDLWREFRQNPKKLVKMAKDQGWNGSDQAVLSLWYNENRMKNAIIWPKDCGIRGAQEGVWQWNYPPPGSCIVHCNGDEKHWGQSKPWMRAYNEAFQHAPERTIDDWYAEHPEDRLDTQADHGQRRDSLSPLSAGGPQTKGPQTSDCCA